jgi:hypothetical protein
MWAHQQFDRFAPRVAVEATQCGARDNHVYDPHVASYMNSGILATDQCRPCFHPDLPDQKESSFWTFNGTVPPKLLIGRYGEPILFRHHNGLSPDVRNNAGFGRHTISTFGTTAILARSTTTTGAFSSQTRAHGYHYRSYWRAGARST